ncbi:MAG: MarR family transcriptional regulator [Steroidobacteraceae bacterium]
MPKTSSRTVRHYRGDHYRVEDSIGYLMKLALTALRRRLDRETTGHGLTGVQLLPLLLISRGVCVTATELARLNDIDAGATTRMLHRLEAKGLLKRTRSTHDRRVVRLEVTAAGRAIADEVPFVIAAALNDSLCDFSVTEVESLRNMLRRIVVNAAASS